MIELHFYVLVQRNFFNAELDVLVLEVTSFIWILKYS